jgi:hypothetical protein
MSHRQDLAALQAHEADVACVLRLAKRVGLGMKFTSKGDLAFNDSALAKKYPEIVAGLRQYKTLIVDYVRSCNAATILGIPDVACSPETAPCPVCGLQEYIMQTGLLCTHRTPSDASKVCLGSRMRMGKDRREEEAETREQGELI